MSVFSGNLGLTGGSNQPPIFVILCVLRFQRQCFLTLIFLFLQSSKCCHLCFITDFIFDSFVDLNDAWIS